MRYASTLAMRTLKIFFHDHCFDGVSSAALFSRFYRDVIDPNAAVVAVGMAHRDGDPFDGVRFDGDDHACVDFRFTAEPGLRWWFDHHATAFQPPALREIFEERRLPTHVYDPAAPSCAGLIVRALDEAWAWQPPPQMSEVATWANRVDALDYPSAAEAVSLTAPAQRLAVFLHSASSEETSRCVGLLAERSLDEMAALPEVEEAAARTLRDREPQLAMLRQLAVLRGDVVTIDLLKAPGSRPPGLLGYLLFPHCRYVLSAVATPQAVRISAGHNPWFGLPSEHHLGELCQRYGGGGHAAVGGVTLGPDELERGQMVLQALTDALTK